MKKIVSVVGARPQFIKAFPVTLALFGKFEELLVHTGQHYDKDMSDIFFNELGLKKPHYNLGVKAESHAEQTGQMMVELEKIFIFEDPGCVMIYGDTNTTLAAALAAAKLNIRIAHVEAGLRSFDRTMPEEINRIIADTVSDYLFAPTVTAVYNLKSEGIERGVHRVGDVMYDAALYFGKKAEEEATIGKELALKPGEYFLCTIHRSGNTDERANLQNIVEALAAIDGEIIFPVHPRTRKNLNKWGLLKMIEEAKNIKLIKPAGYFDFIWLEKNARLILTDSGGIQKEAYYYQVPCITLRENTEWVETLESGWNVLVGTNKAKIRDAVRGYLSRSILPNKSYKNPYGDGDAAEKIAKILKNSL